MARTLPACASCAIVVIASNIICTLPARTLVRASALPLCGHMHDVDAGHPL